MKVFVYGTLRMGSCRDHRLPGNRQIAVLKGYELHQMAGADFPYIAENPEGFVLGELVEVPSNKATKVLERLDAIEGHPHFYMREEVVVTPVHINPGPPGTFHVSHECWTYTMPRHRQHDGGLIPSGDFFDFPGNLQHRERAFGTTFLQAYKGRHPCPGCKTTNE